MSASGTKRTRPGPFAAHAPQKPHDGRHKAVINPASTSGQRKQPDL